jgi:hypothetical protein
MHATEQRSPKLVFFSEERKSTNDMHGTSIADTESFMPIDCNEE